MHTTPDKPRSLFMHTYPLLNRRTASPAGLPCCCCGTRWGASRRPPAGLPSRSRCSSVRSDWSALSARWSGRFVRGGLRSGRLFDLEVGSGISRGTSDQILW